MDWLPEGLQKSLDSIGKLKFKDGKMLIAAKPLLDNLKNGYKQMVISDTKVVQAGAGKAEKQKGRYRLTKDEIKKRKTIVNDAIKKKSELPFKTWKQVAHEMDIPERTLRDYRHNPIYK